MDTQAAVLYELEPVVAQNLDRHLKMAKEWFPHDYVPWSRGRDFAFLGGEDWQPEDSPLDPVAKTALTVNLLTEDNLPSYHREIATRFSRDGAWGTWIGQWTAEEGRHSIALRDYLVVTRGVDPVALSRRQIGIQRLDHPPRRQLGRAQPGQQFVRIGQAELPGRGSSGFGNSGPVGA